MKKALLLLLLLTAYIGAATAALKTEHLNYVISYKWGLIHKDAGDATLSLVNRGDTYDVRLTAKTKPWADKIFMVRDTLSGTIRIADMKPIHYTKIAHEDGKYSRDDIKYNYYGSVVEGQCKRYKNKKGHITTSEKKLTGSRPVYDMLSVFYYLRLVNYADLSKGKKFNVTIFSGSKSEQMAIRCLGTENIKLKNKSSREAFHIRFNFTTDGGKKSSDDIDVWISTDPQHIPLYVVGKLPIGEVRAYYLGQ